MIVNSGEMLVGDEVYSVCLAQWKRSRDLSKRMGAVVGGDCPGLNAVIRSAAKTKKSSGGEIGFENPHVEGLSAA